jgi:hypothetical protein
MNDVQTLISDETILRGLGLDGLPEAERAELLAELGATLYEAVMRRAWNALDMPRQDELLLLLEQNATQPGNEDASQAVASFLTKNVQDLDRFINEELDDLRTTYENVEGELA